MENWQQTFLRTDPWPSIPFAGDVGLNVDTKVGLVCIACLILAWLFE